MLIGLAVGLTLIAGTAIAVTAADAPTFNFVNDQDGPDDEPGQKDLNAHAAATDEDGFWVAFKWDVTGLSGKNTADGCALFDTDSPPNGLVDAAICVTVDKNPAVLKSVVIYTCGDGRIDRCTNPTVVTTASSTTCFINNQASDPFHGSSARDTQATCLIDLASIQATTTPRLVNTCSYPSQEPNSDPSDCVLKVSITTGATTQSSGSTTWSATLNDVATVSPIDATGTVTFRLYSDSACATTPIWTSTAVAVNTTVGTSQGTASTANSGAGTGSNTVTQATVDSDGKYYWTATYTPTTGSDFTPFTTACGEETTITPASVAGSAG